MILGCECRPDHAVTKRRTPRDVAIAAAVAQLQAELRANAPAIAEVLDDHADKDTP